MKAALVSAAMVASLAPAATAAPAVAPSGDGKDGLSTLIDRNLRSGGSWFTPAEQALIERKCGYAPGEWGGFDADLSRGTFTFRNGRVVDDPEIRAVLRAAAPRIEPRVEAVMARADVASAITRVAETAAAEALREVESRRR